MWYGWSEMQRDLTEIKELADNMRRNRPVAAAPSSNSTSLKRAEVASQKSNAP
jgi:hypothetical protein